MEGLEGRLVELIDKLEGATEKLAPITAELAAQSLFVDGIVQLSITVIFLIIFVLSICMFIYTLGKEGEGKADETILGWCFGTGVVSAFFVVILTFAGNPWLKVFAPDAALVKQLILN